MYIVLLGSLFLTRLGLVGCRNGWVPPDWIERDTKLENISNNTYNKTWGQILFYSFFCLFLVVNNTSVWHYSNGYGRLYSYSRVIWLDSANQWRPLRWITSFAMGRVEFFLIVVWMIECCIACNYTAHKRG